MLGAMRYLTAFLLVSAITAVAQSPCVSKRTQSGDITLDCSGAKDVTAPDSKPTQTADPLGLQYSSYTLLLVPQQKGAEGYMVAIDKYQKLAFIPISSIKQAMDDGAAPVRYGDVLQLVGQLSEENSRLKAENEHLWKVAEAHAPSASPVIVQQQAPPTDPSAARRAGQLMVLRSLLTQRSTVNMNITVSDCTRLPALCAGR